MFDSVVSIYLCNIGHKALSEGKATPNEPHRYHVMGQANDVLVKPKRAERSLQSLMLHCDATPELNRQTFQPEKQNWAFIHCKCKEKEP